MSKRRLLRSWLALAGLPPLALLGIVLYMFLVGLELNPGEQKGQGHAAVLTSHASIIVPFTMGAILALFLSIRGLATAASA